MRVSGFDLIRQTVCRPEITFPGIGETSFYFELEINTRSGETWQVQEDDSLLTLERHVIASHSVSFLTSSACPWQRGLGKWGVGVELRT